MEQSLSEYTDISVGEPQGTKLGPILWLFYVNDLSVDNVGVVKYADDTSFYKTIKDPNKDLITPAILQTQTWSDENKMSPNADKTVIMNIFNNYRNTYKEPIIMNEHSIIPSKAVKFLGVYIDHHLVFSTNTDKVNSKANSRIYFLRQLKILGMDSNGLCTFYSSNIRTLLSYASPAWYSLLSQGDKDRLGTSSAHSHTYNSA